MKNRITIAIAVMALLLLSGCGSTTAVNGNSTETSQTAQEEQAQSRQEPEASQAEEPEEVEGGDTMAQTDEEQILAVYRQMHQAMIDKDTEALREIMGADSTVTHISGRTQTMDEWLADIENEDMKYYNIEITDLDIQVDGDRATLRCSNVIEARIYGAHGTWTLPGSAEFEKVDGQWIRVRPEN